MSDPQEPQPSEPPTPMAAALRSLRVSDRISLAAVATAAIALLVGIVQTMFMWSARNDEVEASLRAEQLRACVSYRNAALDLNIRAQIIAQNGAATDEDDEVLHSLFDAYQVAIVELGYLLPQPDGPALDQVQDEATRTIEAYLAGDMSKLAAASASDSAWSHAHNGVLDACDRVIRDVRDP